MKKTIIIALLCAWSIPTLAQSVEETPPRNLQKPAAGSEFKQERKEWRASKRIPYRHDFRIGIGYMAPGGFYRPMVALGDSYGSTAPIYIFYGYRIVGGLKVAMTLGYNQTSHTNTNTNYDVHNHNFRIAPAIQYEWFNRGLVTMYSDIGFNWIIPSGHVDSYDNYHPMGYITPNITPFGMTIGGKNWFGHIELFSLGARGLFNAGVGYRF